MNNLLGKNFARNSTFTGGNFELFRDKDVFTNLYENLKFSQHHVLQFLFYFYHNILLYSI